MIRVPLGVFHSIDCAMLHGRKKAIVSNAKALRVKHKADKSRVKRRYGKDGHYDNLKTELHKYIKHVLRKGEPCYTCGKQQSFGDSGGAFHCGHFIPSSGTDCRRFMLENIRIQCYSCNSMNSGRRVEYREKLIDEMGLDHVEWLECAQNHPELVEQFPDIEDIKKATAKYRKMANQK